MDQEKSIAHIGNMNSIGKGKWPDGLVPWRDPVAPDMKTANTTTGRLRGCDYCGSMHPADVAAAIRAGAQFHWADFKYGWPHKAYGRNIPNPHAGLPESRMSTSRPPEGEEDRFVRLPAGYYNQATGEPEYTYCEKPKPAPDTTHGKFYSVHLKDATKEDRETIERHLGARFVFDDPEPGYVDYGPFKEAAGQ